MAADQPTARAGKPVPPKKAKKAAKKIAAAKKAVAGKKVSGRPAQAAAKGRVSHSVVLSRDEAAAYLDAIVGGLRSGSIRFRQGERRVVLHPAERLTLAVRARDGGKKDGIAFEISWRKDDPAATKDAPAS